MKQKRFLSMFALLLMAATGAWAQTETLLTTIKPTGQTTFSETTSGVVTVTHDNNDFSDDYGWLWYSQSGSLTVEAKEGYTITRCVFKQNDKTPATITSSPFAITFNDDGYCVQSNDMDGVTSIEVYGYAPAPAATTYSVTLAEGTEDSDNWTISPTEAAEGAKVTVTYSGEKKVKSVKAVKKAAPAPSVPDGAINGKFSVSATKKVYFSKGNLRYASSKWSFFDNQYDYYTSYSADAWDKFGWSTSATTYGMNTSPSNSTYSGDFVDWGGNSDLQTALGTGWYTLSKDEWTYLFNTRTVNGGTGSDHSYTLGQEVNDVPGVVLYPDGYTGEVYSGSNWATFEAVGCVFLPAAGYRDETSVSTDSNSSYWSSTADNTGTAYCVDFYSGYVDPASNYGRSFGCSVRLVREVAAQ